MNAPSPGINIELVLVVLSFLSGLIWAIDHWVFLPKRQVAKEQGNELAQPLIAEYARSLFPIFFIVLLLRSFLFEPFRIPSKSMMPTLLVGDFILVNKYTYGLRLPVLHTKIMDINTPQRGDVVVFRYPRRPEINYIKRLIGVPGDHIVYKNKHVYVNGKLEKQQLIGKYPIWCSDDRSFLEGRSCSHLTENLEGKQHDILIREEAPVLYHEFIIPEGQYFMMGDNRDNSNDSRFWGTVPEENLVGRAVLVWMSWDWGHGISWQRIGNVID